MKRNFVDVAYTNITMRNDYVNIFSSFFLLQSDSRVPYYYKLVIVISFSLSQSLFCCTGNYQINIFLTFSEFFFCFKVMIEREEVLDLSSCQKVLQTSERNERQKRTNKQTNKQTSKQKSKQTNKQTNERNEILNKKKNRKDKNKTILNLFSILFVSFNYCLLNVSQWSIGGEGMLQLMTNEEMTQNVCLGYYHILFDVWCFRTVDAHGLKIQGGGTLSFCQNP